jgi:hypothetical protein
LILFNNLSFFGVNNFPVISLFIFNDFLWDNLLSDDLARLRVLNIICFDSFLKFLEVDIFLSCGFFAELHHSLKGSGFRFLFFLELSFFSLFLGLVGR